jgi:predicted secreted protein
VTPFQSILWRLGLTMGVLVLLASCGIEQSVSTPAPPTEAPSAASPPSPTALVLSAQPTPAATPSPSPSPSSAAPSQAPTLTPTLPNSSRPARLTVTLADDGKTITLQVGDRFLLDLGALYAWQVTVADTSILNHVPNTGDKDNQGLYEAYKPGSTTLTAMGTPFCYNAVPRCLMPSRLFTLHVNVTGGNSSGLTVTMADDGKTIPLAVGQRFLLSLGQDFDWTVTVDDPNIVSRVVNITVVKSAQGVYEANKVGTTALHATGVIICPPGKVCSQIALAFRVQMVVQ